MRPPDVRKNLRRGVYIIPTSFTVLNLFFGFRSIVNSTRGIEAMANGRSDLAIQYFEVACLSLFIAAVFDTFDGLIARGLGATSEFGKEYDSLADAVTFGVAPAVLEHDVVPDDEVARPGILSVGHAALLEPAPVRGPDHA